jgi:NAD(P)-dependent dehydrogenase (short-subunit alcohol dehydrogenase family)
LQPKLFDLQGQVALVTGAAQGLGLSSARYLADSGAAVILSDRTGTACLEVAAQLRGEGFDSIGIECDLSEDSGVAALRERSLAWKGRIDTLVSNAGISGPFGPSHLVTDEQWNATFQVNLRAAAGLVSGLVPAMAARGSGSVILMSSIAGLRGNKSLGVYAMTKAALAQLARNVAVEWGPQGIRANSISPGLIRTPLSVGLMGDENFMQRRTAQTPLRRVGEDYEVAAVVVLLASRGGAFITGQNIVVDGGTLISDGS